MKQVVDTLVCDTARIHAWQQDPAFDYNRELIEPQQNILQWLFELIMSFISEVINDAMRFDVSNYLMATLAIVLVVVVGWLVYKYKPALFGRSKKEQPLDYTVEEDTIYGIDFPEAISQALTHNDYREAVRLKYLETLKMLTESERIDWQLHKTPTQYTYECLDEAFGRMTQTFLRIRYGNFEATKEHYAEMVTAYDHLANPHHPSPNPHHPSPNTQHPTPNTQRPRVNGHPC